jgi:DNA-binding TFAR19-related protein (PDSD5 family)
VQVTELLKHPDRHFELMPIIEAGLPLLTAPLTATAGSHLQQQQQQSQQQQQQSQQQQQQQQEMQESLVSVCRSMLGSLSRAVATTAAVAAADRAAAVAASLSGQVSAGVTSRVWEGQALDLPPGAAASEHDSTTATVTGAGDGGVCWWDQCTLNLLLLGLR